MRSKMNRRKFLFAIIMALGSVSSVRAGYLPLGPDMLAPKPQITILHQNAEEVQLEVQLPGVELLQGLLQGKLWDRVEIPGGGYENELGAPEVPHFTRLLAIPATAAVQAEFEALETTVLSNIELLPAQGLDPQDLQREPERQVQFDMAAYSRDAFYPAEQVSVGAPALLRCIRVVPLRTNPVQYNRVTHELRVTHKYRITIHFAGTDLRNVPRRVFPISRSWANLMRSVVVNFDDLALDEIPMGSYLIVCANESTLIASLQPLVDWKKRKGHEVTLLTFTPYSTNIMIKNLIQTAYDTWPVPPEFVLLAGDIDGDYQYQLPGWTVDWYYNIDHPYSLLEGGDILADVALGRFPADNATQMMTMLNKVLYYEKMPYVGNDQWYHQSVLVAGSAISGSSTVQTNRWVKTRMVWNNFTRIDTLWYWMGGSVAATISGAINDGVTYCNYRGWVGMENFDSGEVDALSNGRMMPFCTLITCDTGGFGGLYESIMQYIFKAGTPLTPQGAIGAIGTATLNTNTRFNNTMDMGVYASLFDEGITQAGNALNRGKLELYNTYQANDPMGVDNFSHWNALAGDPGTELYTGALRYMTSDIPDSLAWGVNTLTLTVNETGVGLLEGATACLYMPGTGGTHVVGVTGANGQVTLPLDVSVAGNVKVTLHKQNFFPIVDSLDVVETAVAVGYYSHTVNDDNVGGSTGDNDGLLNPGETVEIPLIFKNYGNAATATSVSVSATEADPYAALSDSFETFPDLAAGDTAACFDDLDLVLAADCPHGHNVHLDLTTSAAQGFWDGEINLPVVSYNMTVLSAVAGGSDPLLSPGETADLILTANNVGGKAAVDLAGTLISLDSLVLVNDSSARFGTIGAGATATCSGNPFNLTAGSSAPPGHLAQLQITYHANQATQTDTISIALGAKSSADPQGPDGYGYYCFDDTDLNYGLAPLYSWVECDPRFGGFGVYLPLSDPGADQDASLNLTLPFVFQYYGQEVTQITVCTNGWLSLVANNSFTDFRNYPIPSPPGPNGMIAPFWDDLTTQGEGRVAIKNDSTNHRFVVEWSHMPNLGWTGAIETFEVILFDPLFYPTASGDGNILMQYFHIEEVYGSGADNPFSTVGIESPDQQDGLQIAYWNMYPDPAAAHLQDGRAYLFTTDFSYSLPGNLNLTLTPYGTPIVIPPAGGTFNYGIAVSNGSASPASADIWCMVTLPNGTHYGPVLGPALVSLPAGYATSRDRTQAVPAGAPAGNYTYHAYIGLYPNVIYDQDSFPFSKSGVAGALSWDEGWENWGEEIAGATADTHVLPAAFALYQAYPNPFNPAATVTYDLPQAAFVKLAVFDLLGRQVSVLQQERMPAGVHQILWDASQIASGIYLLRLEADDYAAAQKLVLMK